jgi:hypothetical protein
MRVFSTLCGIVAFVGLNAQQINNVTTNPSAPSNCVPVRFIFSGTLPSQAEINTFEYGEVGNTVTFDLFSSGGGSMVPFTHPIEFFGPYAVGSYNLVVNLHHNGPGIDHTWNGAFTIAQAVPPELGEPGTRTVCNNDDPFPLVSVIQGTVTGGGIWFDPQSVPVPNGIFVPGVSLPGFYIYQIPLLPPCEEAFQYVEVYYTPNTSAGIGGPLQVCSQSGVPPVDLFEELGGTPEAEGMWTGPSALTGPNNSLYTPGVNTPGAYTYTVPGIAPCGAHSATLTVQGVAPPNAGNGSTVTLCPIDTGNVLNPYVTGEQTTGSWYNPQGFFLAHYNQPVDIATSGSGTYFYVVSSDVCRNDTAFLNLTVLTQPCGIGVEEIHGNVARMDLSPNPAEDRVTIDVQLREAGTSATLELIDLDGRLVQGMNKTFQGTQGRWQLSLEGLSPGVYLVRLRTPDGGAVRRLMVR